MTAKYVEYINEDWESWCFFRKTKYDRFSKKKHVIDSGEFQSENGVLRAGNYTYNSSSVDRIENKTIIVLVPDLSKMNNYDAPIDSSLFLNISSIVPWGGFNELLLTVKLWTNPDYPNWNSSDEREYDDFYDYYIPLDLTNETYSSSLYEITNSVYLNQYSLKITGLNDLFYKIMKKKAYGVMISAINGNIDIYGPESNSLVRPYFEISQIITGRKTSIALMDVEVAFKSKVKGVCRSRSGSPLVGEECVVIVYRLDFFEKIGSGKSSSVDGSFLVDVFCKKGESVLVSFFRLSDGLSGSEIMQTVSRETSL